MNSAVSMFENSENCLGMESNLFSSEVAQTIQFLSCDATFHVLCFYIACTVQVIF